MVSGIVGILGANKHLLLPNTNQDGKPTLSLSPGYHNIFKKNGIYYGVSGTTTKEIAIEVKKPD